MGVEEVGIRGRENLIAPPEMGPAEQDRRSRADLISGKQIEFVAEILAAQALRRRATNRGDKVGNLILPHCFRPRSTGSILAAGDLLSE